MTQKKHFQKTIKITVFILLSNILYNCKNSEEELKADHNTFEVIINTSPDIDSLSMYPSMVAEKFLETSYTFLFNPDYAIEIGLNHNYQIFSALKFLL